MTAALPKIGENRGSAGQGRPRGARNRTTTALKEAILLAAERTGFDGEGADGLEGYLRHLAQTEARAFTGLLGKVLPLELRGQLNLGEGASKEQRDAAVNAALRADS
jgi:hypothetical protein